MFSFLLNVFRFYLPMILGISYVLGYERKKLDNLLKYFIINIHLCMLHEMILSSFSTNMVTYIMVPIYVYLSLFNYAYAGVTYDIICAPLFGIMLESYEEMIKNVERERVKVKLMIEDGEKPESKEKFIPRLLTDVFNRDNIFLLN